MLCYSQIKNENNEIINCSKIEIFDGRYQGNWQIKNHIASGFYGKVYSICNSSENCHFIAKILNIKKENVKKEIAFQLKAISLHVAPKIYQVCYNKPEKTALIIMEKLDYTLETIIENVLKSTELTIDAKKILFHELLQFIVDAIKILHNHGITHGDSHLQNFMYNKNLEKWQIIDFGLATDDIHDKNEDFEQLLDSFHRKIGFVMFKDVKEFNV